MFDLGCLPRAPCDGLEGLGATMDWTGSLVVGGLLAGSGVFSFLRYSKAGLLGFFLGSWVFFGAGLVVLGRSCTFFAPSSELALFGAGPVCLWSSAGCLAKIKSSSGLGGGSELIGGRSDDGNARRTSSSLNR